MSRSSSPTVPVVCALGRGPEFVVWLSERVERDRYIAKRIALLLPTTDSDRATALSTAAVYTTFRFSPTEFRLCRDLKWLHLGLAGVESALFPAFKRSRVVLTSSVGLHDDTVPSAAMAFILNFATGLHEGYAQKQKRIWKRKDIVLSRRPLSGQRLLVIGTGRIGQRIGRLAKSHGMDVWGIQRSRSSASIPGFDRILTAQSLISALPEADYVVLAVPGGTSTKNLIGVRELACMKQSAYLINIARGSVINERALLSALKRGTIAGAGLDVFAEEPLSPDHPFYTLPNVAMTPHTSGDTADYSYRAAELFLKNLKRYLQGKELLNVVDKQRGY